MTQRDNILQELNELGSLLTTTSASNVYHVPTGYFDGLASEILSRIRALEAESGSERSLLSDTIGRITPYQVPAGYFDGLEKKLMRAVLHDENQETSEEELESLSPLLSGLKKQAPYTVPENYFETLAAPDVTKEETGKAKVISLGSRKWFRYAAAAVITGIVSVSAFLLIRGNQSIDPSDKSYAWVKKNMKKVSTVELDSFINMAEQEIPAIASASPAIEVKDLIKRVSEEEIQDFLNDAQDAEPDSNDDILLN